MLDHSNEDHRVALQTIKVAKKRNKTQYDHKVLPRTFHEGDLILVYDHAHDVPGNNKFDPIWLIPYIIRKDLGKVHTF